MSIPKTATVTCQKCGKQFETTIFESVNTGFSQDLAERVVSGELFRAICPACGFTMHLEYDLLYHDMKHGAMVWAIHPGDENEQERIAEIRTTNELFHYDFTRIVPCLETGKDDRVIELCKLFHRSHLASQKPDFRVKRAFYAIIDKKPAFVFLDEAGRQISCFLNDELYELFAGKLREGSSKTSDEPFQIIDCDWAIGFLKSLPDPDASVEVSPEAEH